MSISNYTELKTAVDNWLDRTDLTDRVPEFIALGEARIYRNLRVRGMEARDTSTTIVGGTQYYTLPTDFIEARNVQINTNPVRVLKYLTPEQMDVEYPYTYTGQPIAYTIIGEEIQLGPVPAQGGTLEIAYYKRLAALSDSNLTNWLTSNAPDLLLYGSLIEAEAFLVNDPRVPLWKAAFDEAIAEWNRQEMSGRHSGSHLSMRTDTGNP